MHTYPVGIFSHVQTEGRPLLFEKRHNGVMKENTKHKTLTSEKKAKRCATFGHIVGKSRPTGEITSPGKDPARRQEHRWHSHMLHACLRVHKTRDCSWVYSRNTTILLLHGCLPSLQITYLLSDTMLIDTIQFNRSLFFTCEFPHAARSQRSTLFVSLHLTCIFPRFKVEMALVYQMSFR